LNYSLDQDKRDMWYTKWYTLKVLKNKNPHSQGLRGFKGGPTWTRTNLLNISLSIDYKFSEYPKGI
jgi:hypothetical protein